MRRQFARKALLASLGAGESSNPSPLSAATSNIGARSYGGGGAAQPALTPATSTAYKQTVQFPREKLFTTNHRTTEYFASNEKQILQQLRAAIANCTATDRSTSSGGGSPSVPFWLVTRIAANASSSSSPSSSASLSLSAEQLSEQLYAQLNVVLTSLEGDEAAVTTSTTTSSSSLSASEMATTLRNLLALRSHHGLVLTDQLLVLSVLAVCAPYMAQRPEAAVVVASGHHNGSGTTTTTRVLSAEELGCSLPAAATSPTMASPSGASFPPAVLDLLRVIADEQRLPLHPLVMVSVTALARQMDANTSMGALRYKVGGAASSAEEGGGDHLSHAVRHLVEYQLKPLMRSLTRLGMLVDSNANGGGIDSSSSAQMLRTYYGDGSSASIANAWFGSEGSSSSSGDASIDLAALYRSLVDDATSADSQPFRRRSDDGTTRQLSALERSMLSSTPSSSGPSSNNANAKQKEQPATLSTTTNIKVLHLKLVAALAELAASLACPEVLAQLLHTVMVGHEDVFSALLAEGASGDVANKDEVVPLLDNILQLLGYGYFMSEYASSGDAAMPLAVIKAMPRSVLAKAITALAEGQPAGTPDAALAANFAAVFPTAAGYWAACTVTDNASDNALALLTAGNSTTNNSVALAIRKELDAIIAYKRTMGAVAQYCGQQLFPTQQALLQLLPSIVDGEHEAAVKALEEMRASAYEQLWRGLVEIGGADNGEGGYLMTEVFGPAAARIAEAMAAVTTGEVSEADSIAHDAVVSTALRTVVEAIRATLVQCPPEDGGSSSASSVPRIVAYASERFDYLGTRLFSDDPNYDPLLSADGESAASSTVATVFSAEEYQCLGRFFSYLTATVLQPLLADSSAPIAHPRTTDLALALQRELVGLATAVVDAELRAASAYSDGMSYATPAQEEERARAISLAGEAIGPLVAFNKQSVVPSAANGVTSTLSAPADNAALPADVASLVGPIVQLAVSGDALEAKLQQLVHHDGPHELRMARRIGRGEPLITACVKPLLRALFGGNLLKHHTAEMADAALSASSATADTTTSSAASDDGGVISVGGKGGKKKKAPSADAGSSPLELAMAGIPAAEVFRPTHSFVALYEAARREEDVELSLMLRALRTALFN